MTGGIRGREGKKAERVHCRGITVSEGKCNKVPEDMNELCSYIKTNYKIEYIIKKNVVTYLMIEIWVNFFKTQLVSKLYVERWIKCVRLRSASRRSHPVGTN